MKKPHKNYQADEKIGFINSLWGKFFVLIVAAVCVVFLLDKILMPSYTKHGEIMNMPGIVGQDTLLAKNILKNINLVPVQEDSQYSEIYSSGKILAQR